MEPCKSSLTSALLWALCSLTQITCPSIPCILLSKMRPTVDHRISCTDIARSCPERVLSCVCVTKREITTEEMRVSEYKYQQWIFIKDGKARTWVFCCSDMSSLGTFILNWINISFGCTLRKKQLFFSYILHYSHYNVHPWFTDTMPLSITLFIHNQLRVVCLHQGQQWQ